MSDNADHDWPVVESVAEYETGWYTGGYDEVRQPDATTKKYYWADLPPAVVVVAQDGDDLVMVEQFRPAIREHCLELVAGFVPDSVAHVEEFWCSTGVLRHRRGIVYAEGLTDGKRKLDGNEFIDVVRVPVAEALARAREAPANDATIEGILLARADGLL